MKYGSAVVLMLVGAGLCAGCQKEELAGRLIKPDVSYGKFALMLTGDGADLVKAKRIDLTMRTRVSDAVDIDVWVVRNRTQSASRGTVVLLHEMGDSKASFLSLGQKLADHGYDAVLPDMRTHGSSTGKYFTWGAKEKRDVKTVVDGLVLRKIISDRLYAVGYSLGGSVAIQYAAIDPRVRGVIALAPAKDMSLGRSSMLLLAPAMDDAGYADVLKTASKIGHFDPSDASAVTAAKALRRPLILAHGKLDMTVPFEHSQAIYDAAAGPKQLVTVPLADHGTIMLGRESWLIEQIDELAKDSAPATTASQPAIP